MRTTTHKPEVVVVTGASAGVGRAIVRAFADRGAHIGLLARGHAGLEGACHDVEKAGGKTLMIPTDVADPEQVEAAAEKVEQTFGPIDIWINVAMALVFSPFKKMEAVDFKRVTEVTYLGQVYGTMAALKRMLHGIRGRSSRWALPLPIEASPCNRPIAEQNTLSRASPNLCVVNSFTIKATSRSRWYSSQP
jgi:NAD(P)-dependent dehydrogenase (short-subunit alcohol dehydrogenase family)